MSVDLNIKRDTSPKLIYEIFKFEISLKKKRVFLILLLGIVIVNLYGILMGFFLPSTPKEFFAVITQNYGMVIILISLFFAGGILADEFDKRTALTNFTKTGRTNFFIGKSLAALTIILVWMGPTLILFIIYSTIYYQQIPIELFVWFGLSCLSGTTYTAIYLLHSAIFRSGSQAMTMAFVTFIILGTAFGLSLAFLNSPYYFPFYADMVGQTIFSGEIDSEAIQIITNMNWAVIMLLCYFIPCMLLAYLKFRKRDV